MVNKQITLKKQITLDNLIAAFKHKIKTSDDKDEWEYNETRCSIVLAKGNPLQPRTQVEIDSYNEDYFISLIHDGYVEEVRFDIDFITYVELRDFYFFTLDKELSIKEANKIKQFGNSNFWTFMYTNKLETP